MTIVDIIIIIIIVQAFVCFLNSPCQWSRIIHQHYLVSFHQNAGCHRISETGMRKAWPTNQFNGFSAGLLYQFPKRTCRFIGDLTLQPFQLVLWRAVGCRTNTLLDLTKLES